MSNRFHNRYHRYAHHSSKDSIAPDAGYDPIASTEVPFRGEFVLSGYLSAFNPQGYYSILTDNILADNEIRATNMFVSSSLTAENMVVHYIDVVFTELSGFIVHGDDYSQTVPAITPMGSIVLLSGIGLSSTTWAAIGGDVLLRSGLTALGLVSFGSGLSITGCLSTDCIKSATPNTIVSMPSANFPYVNTTVLSTQSLTATNSRITNNEHIGGNLYVDDIQSNSTSHVDFNSDIHLTNGYGISGTNAHFTDIYGTNYYGITSNMNIYVNTGWKTAVQKYKYPTFTQWKSVLYDNNLFESEVSPLSSEVLVVVNISALDYRSYGEIEGVVNGSKVAGARVGNYGLLPNANVEHALSAGLWIDNEQTFTFVAPSGQPWSINSLSGYYSPTDSNANIQVAISIFEQNQRILMFVGDTMEIGTIHVNSLTANDGFICHLSACDVSINNGISAQMYGQAPINFSYQGRATGQSSYSEGIQTSAVGDYSHAEGQETYALGESSHTEGKGSAALGDYSHAEGFYTVASGNNPNIASHSEGYLTSAIGTGTHAEGTQTYAFLVGAHAEGVGSIALGNYSHAEGTHTYAIGDGAHSEGWQTSAIGAESHAEGRSSVASGIWSHAEGQASHATGIASHAAGYIAQALHNYSYVWNSDTVTPFTSIDTRTFNVCAVNGINLQGALSATGTIVTNVTSTGMFMTINVNGSALAIPLYLY